MRARDAAAVGCSATGCAALAGPRRGTEAAAIPRQNPMMASLRTRESTVLDSPIVWSLLIRFPWLCPGAALHRAGLEAIAAGVFPVADALFERAAGRYRASLDVEALARLRVHQLIARARAHGERGREGSLGLEVEQRLARLERIQALEPPFDLVPASRLLATWAVDRAPTEQAEAA